MGKVATYPLPPRGSPPFQSAGQNQKWPINGQGGYITPAASGIPNGQGGYITPAASGIPTASERGSQTIAKAYKKAYL